MAVFHDADFVCDLDRLIHIVGDKYDGFVHFLMESNQLVLKADPCHWVQCRKRLVHQHNLRIVGECPGNADTLLLPAAQIIGIPVQKFISVKADHIHKIFRILADLFFVLFF